MPVATPPPPRALLCIERPEEMGRLNVAPTIVRVIGLSQGPNGNVEATLIGGQNVCFRVHGSVGKVEVRFSDPYLGSDRPKIYSSMFFPVRIKCGENNFELFSGKERMVRSKVGDEPDWRHIWILKPASVFCRSNPQWPSCPDPGAG